MGAGFALAMAIGGLMHALPAHAFEVQAGENYSLNKDVVFADDLMVTGGEVTIDGTVDGDLVVFGGNVFMNGTVQGDLMVAGGSVVLKGTVVDDLVVAGGNMMLSSVVGDNVLMTGGMIQSDEQFSAGRDVYAGGGTITLRGSAGRDLKVSGGNVIANMKVGRNMEGEYGMLTLGPEATVEGNLNYTSTQEARLDNAAVVKGEKTFTKQSERREASTAVKESAASRAIAAVSGKIFWGIGFLILALVLSLLFPRGIQTVANTVKAKPGKSVLFGLVAMLLAPMAAVLLMVTFLGIPLAIACMTALAILWFLAKVVLAYWVGEMLLTSVFRSKNVSPFSGTLLGGIVILLVSLVPFAGVFLIFIGKLVTLGALLLGLGQKIRSERSSK